MSEWFEYLNFKKKSENTNNIQLARFNFIIRIINSFVLTTEYSHNLIMDLWSFDPNSRLKDQ